MRLGGRRGEGRQEERTRQGVVSQESRTGWVVWLWMAGVRAQHSEDSGARCDT